MRPSIGFSLIELIVVIAIISLLMAISMPALAGARERSEYARWQAYSHSLRTHPDLLAYYNFEHETYSDKLFNAAVGDALRANYSSEQFDGVIDTPNWTSQGRWTGKPALSFIPELYSRGVRISPKTGSTHTKEITVMGWVRFFGPPSHDDVIADKRVRKDNNRCWSLEFHGDNLRWQTSSNGLAGGRVRLKTDVRDMYGLWMHFAATFDGNEMRLYINGGLRDQGLQSKIIESTQPIYIAGAGANGARDKLNALMDELAIFRRALTLQEIRQHYLVGEPGNYTSPRGFDDDGNNGHGNDEDGYDEGNPGNGDGGPGNGGPGGNGNGS